MGNQDSRPCGADFVRASACLVHGRMTDAMAFYRFSAGIIAVTIVVASLSYRWLEAPIMSWARGLE